MKITVFLLLLSSLAQASWDAKRDFLCFQNKDPGMEEYGTTGLGWFATKTGACQGMAGIAAAFKNHARFEYYGNMMSTREARALIKKIRAQYASGCPGKITVPGYSDLMEFCRDFREEFLAQSVDFNASIAVNEISGQLVSFLSYKDHALKSVMGRSLLHLHIQSLKAQLAQGRSPLMLVYSHVRTVLNVKESPGKVQIELYENNDSSVRIRTINYASDGLPAVGSTMLWDVTPRRDLRCL